MARRMIAVLLSILVGFAAMASPVYAEEAALSFEQECRITLSQACDWLDGEDTLPLTFFCLGTAGKSASSDKFTSYLMKMNRNAPYNNASMVAQYMLSFTFSGYHASQIEGVDLLSMLFQCDKPESVSGAAYTILALHSNRYTQDRLVFNDDTLGAVLLDCQNQTGGFRTGIAQGASDVGQTALALTALSVLPQNELRRDAIRRGLAYLEEQCTVDGDYLKQGEPSGIYAAQVLIAKCSLAAAGLLPGFSEQEKTELLRVLMRYVQSDGSFADSITGESDVNATMRAIMALSAAINNKNPFLMMTHIALTYASKDAPNVFEEPAKPNPSKRRRNLPQMMMRLLFVAFLGLLAIYLAAARFHLSAHRKQRHLKRTLKKLAPFTGEPKEVDV